MIHTTIRMRVHLQKRIRLASLRSGISSKIILVSLAKKVIRESSGRRFCLRPVRYQRRCADEGWRTIHLSLPEEVYQKCVDLRGLFKFSVSWFFSRAVELFLDDVMRMLEGSGNSDNNQEFYHIRITRLIAGLHYVVYHAPKTEERKT
jgi:hypothetical protein